MLHRLLVLLLFTTLSNHVLAQGSDTSIQVAPEYVNAISSKASAIGQKLDKKAARVLQQMQKQEKEAGMK